MAGFDLNKYSKEYEKKVDMKKTKKNLSIFLNAYFRVRERAGQPREPKLSVILSEVPVSSGRVSKEAEDILIYNEQVKEEFLELHDLYIKGYSAIQVPFSAERTERRKKIFYDRMVKGYTEYVTAERRFIAESLVRSELKQAIIQFCQELDIVEYKKG